jgi:DNA-binding IclR family transcriptional regulator
MEDNQIAVLKKALNIFETVSEQNGAQTLNDISKKNGLNSATAYRILATMKDHGLLVRDANKYAIDENVLYSLSRNNYNGLIRETAYEAMREASYSKSRAMNLIARCYEKCFIVQQIRTGKAVEFVPPLGTKLPIYASAGGKILLSELPPILLQEILQIIELKPFTKRTITKKIDLMHELETIRSNDYALDVHESVDKGYCIAVPVRDNHGKIFAALSFTGFIGNFENADIGQYYPVLCETSQKITQCLFKDE